MAQPNVVREPSMDEILASIRRIIESNDPVPNSGLATANAQPEGFAGHVANDYGDHGEEEVTLTVDEDMIVEAFEAENRGNEGMRNSEPKRADEPAPVAEAPQNREEARSAPRPLSLADVAARVRAASERNGALRDLQKANETNVGEHAPTSENAEIDQPESAGFAGIEPVEFGDEDNGEARDFHNETGGEEIELEPIDLAEEPDLQAVALIEVEEEEHQASPLLSPTIGEKVSRSFDDLSEAVHLSGRRTFDEIAAELLRPMLQEWLDDNLPTLVERLVREEIERVARGPRR